jgi:hypothetical protein
MMAGGQEVSGQEGEAKEAAFQIEEDRTLLPRIAGIWPLISSWSNAGIPCRYFMANIEG